MTKQINLPIYKQHASPGSSFVPNHTLLSYLHLAVMECAIIFIAIVLPLSGLFFYQAFPDTQLGRWLLLPTRLLFPGRAVILPIHSPNPPPVPLSVCGQETVLLLIGFIVLFTIYLLAIRNLPNYVTHRYVSFSTLVLGLTYSLIPVITSQDIFSYIGYARMAVIHHLNPLTTLPIAIHTDPVYPFIFWVNQPSAYGPMWAIITAGLQYFALLFGPNHILSMVLLLRFFGLAMHFGSAQLIWSISGSLQQRSGVISPRTRLAATLAFAWNPLLLFEACVNAHNDTTILFLILLALWSLQSQRGKTRQPYLLAVILLALAACIKITFLLLVPGLLLFLWTQRSRRIQRIAIVGAVYAGVTLLLYVPFWQHGSILHLLQINPGTSRDINSLYDFGIRLYASIRGTTIPFVSYDTGSRTEIITHQIGTVIFLAMYAALCVWSLITQRVNTLPSLVRWMALVWFLYCLIGSPWFWPWYIVAFFGLAMLLQATSRDATFLFGILRLPLALRLLTFSVLSIYCFFTWWPHATPIAYLHDFQLSYIRGLWAWGVLVLAINPRFLSRWKKEAVFAKRKVQASYVGESKHIPPEHISASTPTITGPLRQ